MEGDGTARGLPDRLNQWPVGPEGEEGSERDRGRCEENWERQSWDALGGGSQNLPPSQGC